MLFSMVPLLPAVEPPAEPMSVWFTTPAKTYHEASVLGNGRLGAMDFGGVDECRVVLNESSMWSGGPYYANRADAHLCLPEARAKIFGGDVAGAEPLLKANFQYPEGVKGWWDPDQFGCYQILGDLKLNFNFPGQRVRVTSPSGHAAGDLAANAAKSTRYVGIAPSTASGGDDHSVAGSVDGNSRTKWCVPDAGPAVSWQVQLPAARKVDGYTLTSADDMPARDPQEWTVQGSADGMGWTELDKRALPQPFEQRHQAKRFDIATPGEFRFYRFTFTPKDPYFQIGEIALEGVELGGGMAAPADYRRDLNLMKGVASTRFTIDGVT